MSSAKDITGRSIGDELKMEGKGAKVDLQEEILDTLIDVTDKRCEIPKKCANLVAKNLRLQQSLVENSIVLPRTNVKKLACKYPLNKSLNATFNLPEVQVSFEDISSLISQVRDEQQNLIKIIKMIDKQSDQ